MPEQTAPRHTLRHALLALLAVFGLSIGLWMTVPDVPVPPATATVAAAPPAGALPVVKGLGGDFTLPSTRGGELALTSLRGKVVLLNFGFTQCPDVCPMVLTRLGNALRTLENHGTDVSRVQPLFITFDPARDSLDHLRDYVGYFHASLIGLRGDDAQTKAVAKQYRVIYLAQDTGSESGYVFQHSDYIYVIDMLGRVRLLVSGKDPEEAIVESVKALLREVDRK